MMPPVPRLVRYGLTLSLKLLAFGLNVVVVLVDEFADWISPKLRRSQENATDNLSTPSRDREPGP